ncbi:RuBisCO large subunit C-terminal-like domain-containing protein [Modicisalibacter luteus]|uniref:RuBisCO large subunit C-terminal-like domain-containing protein n=1 Tax=Modicisalibacter luteus TaxID=453962 RepID=UPI003632AC09
MFSSGQTARQAVDTYQALGSTDLIFCAGGGIMAHPGGIASGVKSLRQAWDATVQGTTLESYAAEHHELAQALEAFR